MAQTPHMALELLEQSQAQKEVTVNEALFKLDAILNSGAIDRGLDTPPSGPDEGDVYIVGAGPTGLWAGKAQHVAYFHQIWRFIEPNAGLLLWVTDEAAHYVYNGSGWIPAVTGGSGGGGGGGSGDMLKTTYDAANINQQLVGISATQTLTNKTINGSTNTISNINLSSAVTGTLPVARGGTGLATPGAAGNVLTSNGTGWVSQAPAGGGGGSGAELPGFRNLIINGDFRIFQRNVTTAADDIYHIDRWYALNQTGSVSVAQVSDAEDGQVSNIRLTQPDASAKRIGMAQIIEARNCKHTRGKAVCLSARICSSVSQPIRYAILEWTGTADVVTSDVVADWTNASFSVGAFFLASNVTVLATGSTTPSADIWQDISVIGGTVSSSMNNLIVLFWTEDAFAQTSTLEIGLVQLEVAAAPTPFEYRPMQTEMALCQRYLPMAVAGVGPAALAQATANTTSLSFVPFSVAARVPPTGIAISVVGDFRITSASGIALLVTGISFNSASIHAARVDVSVTNGLTAGGAALFYGFNANAKLMFNGAEL